LQTSTQKSYFAFLFSTFKKVGPALFLVNLGSVLLDQKLTDKIQAQLSSDQGINAGLWLFGAGSLLNSILAPLISMSLIFLIAKKNMNFRQSLNQLSQLFREELRATGSVLSYSLLLIIPGVLRYLQLALVPFVVFFDYSIGKTDALEKSKMIFKTHWKKITGLLVVFGAMIPLLMSALDGFKDLLMTPVPALLICGLEVLLFCTLQWFLFSIWEIAHEPDVQKL
jgi:hypothetical protein